jgi:hypothetical protein
MMGQGVCSQPVSRYICSSSRVVKVNRLSVLRWAGLFLFLRRVSQGWHSARHAGPAQRSGGCAAFRARRQLRCRAHSSPGRVRGGVMSRRRRRRRRPLSVLSTPGNPRQTLQSCPNPPLPALTPHLQSSHLPSPPPHSPSKATLLPPAHAAAERRHEQRRGRRQAAAASP